MLNTIFFFSGTGNTKLIAEKICDAFEEKGEEANCYAIENFYHHNIVDFNRIGIGFPIYAFAMPDIMADFIKALPFAKGREAFIFSTAGDPSRVNHVGLTKAKELLKLKGYKVIYERPFVMGCNFLIPYSDVFIKQLASINESKIEVMVNDILTDKQRHVKNNLIYYIIMSKLHFLEENFGAKFFGLGLTTNDSCILCNKCVRTCPTKNISQENDKIVFSKDCIFCMRCMYICDRNAIHPRFFGSIMLKKGYNLMEVLNDDEISINNYVLEDKYKKRFSNYFNNIES